MYVRFAVWLLASALSLFSGSSVARCDLKIVALTHVDCTHLLINGAPITRAQLVDLHSNPRFSPDGFMSIIWVKGSSYRIDELGLTTVTDTSTGAVTVIDRINKLYYLLPPSKPSSAAHLSAISTKLSGKSPRLVTFGFDAASITADLRWKGYSLHCVALSTPELPNFPTGLSFAVPAVADLLPKLSGLPLALVGTVSMPSFMGQMGFDWRVTSLSTATFEAAELEPPADYRRIDPPNPAQGLRIAIEAPVHISSDLESR